MSRRKKFGSTHVISELSEPGATWMKIHFWGYICTKKNSNLPPGVRPNAPMVDPPLTCTYLNWFLTPTPESVFQTRDPAFLKQAYLSYIRRLLEYCSNIWNPRNLRKHINAIEKLQRHFTKQIPSLQSYTLFERLAFLDLEPLELRRLKADLTLYYNIWHNH
jgi:hypothetical protein